MGNEEIDRNKQFLLFPLFSTCLENFLQFSSNLKLLSANSFSFEESDQGFTEILKNGGPLDATLRKSGVPAQILGVPYYKAGMSLLIMVYTVLNCMVNSLSFSTLSDSLRLTADFWAARKLLRKLRT